MLPIQGHKKATGDTPAASINSIECHRQSIYNHDLYYDVDVGT